MHVLIPVLHRPIKPTGVCRHAANLAQCLASNTNISQVTLIIGYWQKDYFETVFNLDDEKIRLVTVDIKNSSVSRNIWYLLGLPRLANSLAPDIVHLSFPFPFIRSKFSCPVVATVHDLYPYEFPENFGFPQVIFNQLFLKQCLDNGDGFACVSQITLEKLKFYFPKLKSNIKIKVIYNYVDFSNVASRIPRILDSFPTTPFPFLISVAQHRKNKNLDLLIQAYAELLQGGNLKPDTKLILIGSSGPETENLKKQISTLNLQNQLLLLSSLEDGELRWLYEKCEMFIIPSTTEGFCFPLVEALYLGCKAICSDIPIFREVGFSECTYFQLEGDAVANLSKAIIQALEQPRTQSTVARDCFSKSQAARQYIEFYSSLIMVRL
jgi:glycosyltransferase involved in cell wall biosynthesis